MNKALIVVVILILLGLGIAYFWSEPMPPVNPGEVTALGTYFQNKIIAAAINDLGQPVEGFNADLLIMAFPDLTLQDFNGVETIEGYYRLEGSQLALVRNQDKTISTAERTVSEAGYNTLLKNLSNRLGIVINSEADVDALVSRLDNNDIILTTINQSRSSLGLNITPLVVIEDSRCPADTTCIQAGTIRVKAQVQNATSTPTEEIFTLGQPLTIASSTVTLVRAEPEPIVDVSIPSDNYRLYFKIEK